MTEPRDRGATFGISGDAKERHLRDLERLTSSASSQRPASWGWGIAACVALVVLVGGALLWRSASSPGNPEEFMVRCQFPSSSVVLQTGTLLGPEDAIRACRDAQPPVGGFIQADGQWPVTCLADTTRFVFLDGAGECPAGSAPD